MSKEHTLRRRYSCGIPEIIPTSPGLTPSSTRASEDLEQSDLVEQAKGHLPSKPKPLRLSTLRTELAISANTTPSFFRTQNDFPNNDPHCSIKMKYKFKETARRFVVGELLGQHCLPGCPLRALHVDKTWALAHRNWFCRKAHVGRQCQGKFPQHRPNSTKN